MVSIGYRGSNLPLLPILYRARGRIVKSGDVNTVNSSDQVKFISLRPSGRAKRRGSA